AAEAVVSISRGGVIGASHAGDCPGARVSGGSPQVGIAGGRNGSGQRVGGAEIGSGRHGQPIHSDGGDHAGRLVGQGLASRQGRGGSHVATVGEARPIISVVVKTGSVAQDQITLVVGVVDKSGGRTARR